MGVARSPPLRESVMAIRSRPFARAAGTELCAGIPGANGEGSTKRRGGGRVPVDRRFDRRRPCAAVKMS